MTRRELRYQHYVLGFARRRLRKQKEGEVFLSFEEWLKKRQAYEAAFQQRKRDKIKSDPEWYAKYLAGHRERCSKQETKIKRKERLKDEERRKKINKTHREWIEKTGWRDEYKKRPDYRSIRRKAEANYKMRHPEKMKEKYRKYYLRKKAKKFTGVSQ